MDVSLDMWLGEYMEAVQVQFGPRVWFIGLQGSFGRGEATAESDLDVVLILDAVSAADLRAYSAMLDRLPERERVCGFVSGKGELLAWEPADLFQFCHDTRPLLGTLDQVLEKITEGDVHRAVWTGACNVYHMCAHNMVHEKSLDILRDLYQSAGFTLQAIAYLQTGQYARKKQELCLLLQPEDRHILEVGMELRQTREAPAESFQGWSEDLLRWASAWVQKSAGAEGKPVITLFNKQDKVENPVNHKDLQADYSIATSAKTGQGLEEFKQALLEIIRKEQIYIERLYDFSEAGKIQLIRSKGQLLSEEYVPEGIEVKAYVPQDIYGRL